MLLCDALGQCAELAHSVRSLGGDDAAQASFDGIAALDRGVAGAVRLVLDDAVIAAATEVILSRPTSIVHCLSALRIPWPSVWVEWTEAAREAARAEHGLLEPGLRQMTEKPKRVGFLAETDLEGRRGRLRMAWSQRAPDGSRFRWRKFPRPAPSRSPSTSTPSRVPRTGALPRATATSTCAGRSRPRTWPPWTRWRG